MVGTVIGRLCSRMRNSSRVSGRGIGTATGVNSAYWSRRYTGLRFGIRRFKGAIINEMVVRKLSVLVDKLKATTGARIFKRGFEKAVALLNKGEEVGIFTWAPSLRKWFKDLDYVFWLGAGGLRIDV